MSITSYVHKAIYMRPLRSIMNISKWKEVALYHAPHSLQGLKPRRSPDGLTLAVPQNSLCTSELWAFTCPVECISTTRSHEHNMILCWISHRRMFRCSRRCVALFEHWQGILTQPSIKIRLNLIPRRACTHRCCICWCRRQCSCRIWLIIVSFVLSLWQVRVRDFGGFRLIPIPYTQRPINHYVDFNLWHCCIPTGCGLRPSVAPAKAHCTDQETSIINCPNNIAHMGWFSMRSAQTRNTTVTLSPIQVKRLVLTWLKAS